MKQNERIAVFHFERIAVFHFVSMALIVDYCQILRSNYQKLCFFLGSASIFFD